MSCPICSRPSEHHFRPFCSKRCADIDLGKWMQGEYAIASQDPEDVERAVDELEKMMRKPH